MINGLSSRPFSAITLPPIDTGADDQKDKIVKVSRERYANSAKDVEDKITKWSGMDKEYDNRDSGVALNKKNEGKISSAKYQVNCWSCGKKTGINFEPDGERPVYCYDCLNKVKKGENLSLNFKPKIEQKPELEQKEPEQKKTEQKPELEQKKTEQKPELEQKEPEQKKTEQKEPEQKPEISSSISLEKAIKEDPVSFKKKRVSVDLVGLRELLKETTDKSK